MNKRKVKILLGSCGGSNLIRPGTIKNIGGQLNVQARSFDNRISLRKVNIAKSSIVIGSQVYDDLTFLEWNLSDSHDVLLGKRWFSKFNPSIYWRTHEVSVSTTLVNEVESDIFQTRLAKGDYIDVFNLKISTMSKQHSVPDEVSEILNKYCDVFPQHYLMSFLRPEILNYL